MFYETAQVRFILLSYFKIEINREFIHTMCTLLNNLHAFI